MHRSISFHEKSKILIWLVKNVCGLILFMKLESMYDIGEIPVCRLYRASIHLRVR